MDLLPLERLFSKMAIEKSKFPSMSIDYFHQYKTIVEYLRNNVYPHIDTGLAANSKTSGIYTTHSKEHFDEVIRSAGRLLGVETGDEGILLAPYEIYMLLVAIRIHDAGNIFGREDHEKKCFSVLRGCGPAAGTDDSEKKIIATIAQAHGGTTSNGSKDTIGALDSIKHIGSNTIRPRLLASIVRFADEICENRDRTSNLLLKENHIPKHNQIFHKYAASISANVLSMADRKISIRYEVPVDDLKTPWGCTPKNGTHDRYLIDEILDRLEKMDLERRYFNRFSRDVCTIDLIRATVSVINSEHDPIIEIAVPDLDDSGYPEEGRGRLHRELAKYCGPNFAQQLQEEGK